jgi:hypothetical protein
MNMKNKIAIFKYALSVFLVVCAFTLVHAQPTVTVNYNAAGLVPGQYFSVPIILDGVDVGSWRFLIRYDRDVLEYKGSTNTINALGIGLFQASNYYTITAGPNTGEVCYAVGLAFYSSGAPGYTYTSQAVVTLNFVYVGGSTNFTILNISTGTSGSNDSYVKASPYNVVNTGTVFTNGSAGGTSSTPALYSAAGGGTWKNKATWKYLDGSAAAYFPTGIVDAYITGGLVNADSNARAKNLTINAGGNLTLSASKTLKIAENLLIKSDATSTGSFVDLGTTTVTGTTTVERYMTGNWDGNWPATTITWHYVASPVSSGTINSFWGGLLNYWDEPLTTWTPLTWPVTTPLVVNKGYSAAMPSTGVITYTGGTLNTGNRSITGLTNTDASAGRGFNLVGNAFPSAILWNASITRTNVDATAYLWNGATYTTHLTTDGFEIPAEQGFFVHVTAGQTTGSMTIPNSNRTHSTQAYLKAVAATEKLTLAVIGNNLADETSIRINSNATKEFDSEYDAYKMWGTNACPQIYSMIPATNLSINSLPELTPQMVVALGFRAGVNDTYSLTASGIETFPTGTDFYLEDLLLNKIQNLGTNPVYDFTASPGSPAHRFNLHFAPYTGIQNATAGNMTIYASENNVFVNIPMDLHGEIFVYDLLGKEVTHQSIVGNSLNKVGLNVQLGYYLVKVLGDKATVSGKVFIR